MDEASEHAEMIEELSEQNSRLTEENEELKSTLEELEEMKMLAEEIEENQGEVERSLRSEIYRKEVELLDCADKITNLRNSVYEAEKTIVKFRELTAVLQQQLADYQVMRRPNGLGQRSRLPEQCLRIERALQGPARPEHEAAVTSPTGHRP